MCKASPESHDLLSNFIWTSKFIKKLGYRNKLQWPLNFDLWPLTDALQKINYLKQSLFNKWIKKHCPFCTIYFIRVLFFSKKKINNRRTPTLTIKKKDTFLKLSIVYAHKILGSWQWNSGIASINFILLNICENWHCFHTITAWSLDRLIAIPLKKSYHWENIKRTNDTAIGLLGKP